MKRLLLLLCLISAMVIPLAVTQATVSTTAPRNDYIGNGATATYSYTFRIFAASDLRVTKVSTAGVETALALTTNYTVTGVNKANGGTITLLAGNLPSGEGLTIRFDRTPQQSTDLRNQGSFFAETHESKFDELTRYTQSLTDKVSRSIHLPESEVGTEVKTGLPTATVRASKFLAFDGSGNTIVAAGTSANLAPVSGFINTLIDDADAATARATLGAAADVDNLFLIKGSGDATKKLAFEVDGITTGTTRTLTPPNANLTLPNVTAAGDLTIASGSGVLTNLAVGSAGTIPMSRSASSLKLAYVSALSKAISGCTYANAAGDVVNDLDIAACNAMDATGAYWITVPALTKQLDVNWAVGNNAGGLDTGAIGNSDYYLWAIARSDTGVTDYLYSLSSTAPTMPANYDFKRLIGWFKRVGGTIVLFTTYETEGGGLELLWSSPTLDINLANTLTTARRTDAVKVPLNFSVVAFLNIRMTDAAALTAIVYCPDQADLVPSATIAPVGNIGDGISGNEATLMRVRTSSTGTIAARATTATIDLYVASTMGFTWARRN